MSTVRGAGKRGKSGPRGRVAAIQPARTPASSCPAPGEAAPRRCPRGAGPGHLTPRPSWGGLEARDLRGSSGEAPGTSGPSERVSGGGGTQGPQQGGCATCGDPTRARGSRPPSRLGKSGPPRTVPCGRSGGAAIAEALGPRESQGIHAASETNFPTSCSRWQQSSYFVPVWYF